jgi:uncharacterized membrane protein YjjP (DUF1212 family)
VGDTEVDSAALQQFLLLLGSGLTASGEAVNEIERRLRHVAVAYGATDARFAVLPTFIVVALDPGRPATLEPTTQLGGVLRLDQTSALYEVLKRAERGELDPAEGSRAVLDVVALRPRFGRWVRLLGHVILTVGICLMLQPTPDDLVLAAAFGAVVGVLKEVGRGSRNLMTVMPVAAAFLVASTTFVLADHDWASTDLRAMIAPLVTFLPGAALTMSVVELSAGQLVTGASRLVAGALQLVLLAFGIVMAAQAFGTPATDDLVNRPENLLGWWAPWLGVLVFAFGVRLFHSAPRRSFPWLLLVLLVAFVAQTIGANVFGGFFGGFFGALAMTPTARLVERAPGGPPALVSFLPAFWLLVPGALGLIGVTEYIGTDPTVGAQDLLGTVGAILAVGLGVLVGYPLVGPPPVRARRPPRP